LENDPWIDWYAVLDNAIIAAAIGGIAISSAAFLVDNPEAVMETR
jgi:hypothetical protein